MGGLPGFVDEIPEYRVHEGRMHINMAGHELVMPVHVFLKGCERGKAAIVDWQRIESASPREVHAMPRGSR